MCQILKDRVDFTEPRARQWMHPVAEDGCGSKPCHGAQHEEQALGIRPGQAVGPLDDRDFPC